MRVIHEFIKSSVCDVATRQCSDDYIRQRTRETVEGESTDSDGSLVPVVFVIRADLTDLIQVVFEIS